MKGTVAPNKLIANPNQPHSNTPRKANDNITTTKEDCKRLVQIEMASMALQRLYELEERKRRKL